MTRGESADTAAAAASKALAGAVAGGATLSWGGWTSNDIAMLVGAGVAVLGLLVQVYYKRKEYALKLREHEMHRREHEARMSELAVE